MAEKNLIIKVAADVDLGKLTAELDGLSNRFGSLATSAQTITASMEEATKALASNLKGIETVRTGIAKGTSEQIQKIERFAAASVKAVAQLNARLEDMEKARPKATRTPDILSIYERRIQSQLNALQTAMTGYYKALQENENASIKSLAAQRTAAIKRAEREINQLRDHLALLSVPAQFFNATEKSIRSVEEVHAARVKILENYKSLGISVEAKITEFYRQQVELRNKLTTEELRQREAEFIKYLNRQKLLLEGMADSAKTKPLYQNKVDVTTGLTKAGLDSRTSKSTDFKAQAEADIAALERSIKLYEAKVRFGANSIQAIELQAAENRITVHDKLAKDLAAIEARIKSDSLYSVEKGNADKVKVLTDYYKKIVGIQNQIIKAESIQQNTTERAARFQKEAADSIDVLNKRLALEKSIRVNGAASRETLELEAAQKEQTVRQNLANRIAEIDAQIQSRAITNIRDANRLRIAAEKEAADEIVKIQTELEASTKTTPKAQPKVESTLRKESDAYYDFSNNRVISKEAEEAKKLAIYEKYASLSKSIEEQITRHFIEQAKLRTSATNAELYDREQALISKLSSQKRLIDGLNQAGSATKPNYQSGVDLTRGLTQAGLEARQGNAAKFKEDSDALIESTKTQTALYTSIRKSGADSVKGISEKSAQDQLKIERDLATALSGIKKGIETGSIKSLEDALNLRVKVLEDYNTRLQDVRRRIAKAESSEKAKDIKLQSFRKQSADSLTELNQFLELQKAVRTKGADSLQALEVSAAQEELAIRRRLADQIASIEKEMEDNSLTSIHRATRLRIQAEKDAANQIIELQKQVEAKRAEAEKPKTVSSNKPKISDVDTTLSAFRRANQAKLAEMDRQLRLEEVTINKKHRIEEYLNIQAANKEAEIREKLKAKLTAIEKGIADNRISSIQKANDLRVKAVSKASSQILNIRTSAQAAINQERHNKALEEAAQKHKNLFFRVGELTISYRLFSAAINIVEQALLNIPKAGLDFQATQASVFAVFGSDEGTRNLKYLVDLADSAGQSLQTLETSYRNFSPSAILAGASQEEVNQIFKNFTEIGTVLHLPEERLRSLYLALEQMYAKTTVQSEEIKRQLGNILPGAVEVGAKAFAKLQGKAEVSVADFMEAMKNNLVITKKFAPEFAKTYREFFGGKDDSVFEDIRTKLQSNLGRLQTAYTLFSRNAFAIVQETLNEIVKFSASTVEAITANLHAVTQGLSIVGILAALKTLEVAAIAAFTRISVVEGLLIKQTLGLAIAFDKVRYAISLILAPLTGFAGGVAAAVAAISYLALQNTKLEVSYGNFVNATKDQLRVLMETYAAGGEGAKLAGEQLIQLQDQSSSLFVEFEGNQISLWNLTASLVEQARLNIKDYYEDAKQGMGKLANKIGLGWDYIVAVIKVALEKAGKKIEEFFNDMEDALVKAKAGFIALAETIKSIGDIEISLNFADDVLSKFNENFNKAYEEQRAKQDKIVKDLEQKKRIGGDAISNFVSDTYNSGLSLINEKIDGFNKAVVSEMNKSVNQIATRALQYQTQENQQKLDQVKYFDIQLDPTGENTTPPSKDSNKSGAGSSAAKKAQNDLFKDLEREAKLHTKITKNLLDELDGQYEKNLVSINTYFSKKKDYLTEDLDFQLYIAGKQRDLAISIKDEGKIEQYKDKITSLKEEADTIETDITRGKYKALEDYNQLLRETQASYLEFIGETGKAAQIKFTDANKQTIGKLMAQYGEGDVKAGDRLVQFKKVEAITVGRAEIDKFQKKYDEVEKNLASSELRINTNLDTGSITELDALYSIEEARKSAIETMQQYLDKQKQIALQANDEVMMADLDRKQIELDAFLQKSALVAMKFKSIFSSAFSESFTNFVMGTVSAKEAFQQMAASIIKSLVEIAAQQAATGIFNMIVGGISGAFTGNPFQGDGPLLSYANKSYKGNIVSQGNIVPFAKGGIPDVGNKIAYFPLANGGIGSLREKGYEAIMPLARTSSGELGVKAVGSQTDSGGGVVINIAVTVEGGSKGESDESKAARIAEVIATRIAKEEIVKATRPRNHLNKVNKV